MHTKLTTPTRLLAVLALLFLFSAPQPARARVSVAFPVVDTDADLNIGDCTPAPNDCPLRRALAVVNPGTGILFAGNYTITLTLGALAVNTDEIIIDPLAADVRIDGNNMAQVFAINAQSVTLQNLGIFNAGSGSANIWINGDAKNVLLDSNRIGYGDPQQGCSGLQTSPNAYGGVYISTDTSALASGQWRVIMRNNLVGCHTGIPGIGVEVINTNHVLMETEFRPTFTPQVTFQNNIGVKMTGGNFVTMRRIQSIDNGLGILLIDANDNTLQSSLVRYATVSDGIRITGSSQRNLIGGRRSQNAGNRIHSNAAAGISLLNAANNYVVGNDIGFASDSEAGGNQGNGVYLENSNANLIGSAADGTDFRNQIGHNQGHGIGLSNSASNEIKGNLIGTNIAMTGSAPNVLSGIYLAGADTRFNVIGYRSTDTSGGGDTGNVISGNGEDGISVANGARDNIVSGNNIGTEGPLSTPDLAIGNENGISLKSGAQANWIGAVDETTAQNIIAGNRAHGIYISDVDTQANLMANNAVGFVSGLDLLLARGAGDPVPVTLTNGLDGIHITAAAHHNVISYTRAGLIAANRNGVMITGAAHHNTLTNGTVYFNRVHGVLLDGAATSRNVISGTWFGQNAADGIADDNGAAGNVWTNIHTSANGGLGIDRAITNTTDNSITFAPSPPQVVKAGPPDVYTVTVLVPALIDVEIYSVGNPADPSRHGEGLIMQARFVGAASSRSEAVRLSNESGSISGCFTVMHIDRGLANPQSSEFSRNTCTSGGVFLPMLQR